MMKTRQFARIGLAPFRTRSLWTGTALALALGVIGNLPSGLSPLSSAQAQNLFAPRLYVNGGVITEFEVVQRALFMQVLRAPGNPETEALKALVDDRLRQGETKRLGIKVTDKEILDGMEEFAGRAQLTAEQLISELQKVGIAPETFRDFVSSGVAWRHAIRGRYLGRVAISEADVDKALADSARPRALKVLLSELVIPAEPGNEAAAMALAERLSGEISTEGGFASAVRRHSASPTAANGGRIDWMPLANLPGVIAQQILGLDRGAVSQPVAVPGAVVLFQLRDLARDEKAEPIKVTVEWAEFLLPDDPARLAEVMAKADRCLDLYGLANGQPEQNLQIRSASMGEVPRDIGLQIASLDPGEFASSVTTGGNRRLVMLCSRKAVMEPEPSRDDIKQQIINQKLEGMAENYLEELRAAAFIREP